VTRPDQYRTPVEAKLLRLATRRALTPNSKRPDHWTVPQQTGLPSRTYPVDDPSAHDESSICTLPLCPQRIHDSPKILKTP